MPVAVLVSDSSVRSVCNHLGMLVLSDSLGGLNGFSLRWMQGSRLLVTCTLNRPAAVSWNHMLILPHDEPLPIPTCCLVRASLVGQGPLIPASSKPPPAQQETLLHLSTTNAQRCSPTVSVAFLRWLSTGEALCSKDHQNLPTPEAVCDHTPNP